MILGKPGGGSRKIFWSRSNNVV